MKRRKRRNRKIVTFAGFIIGMFLLSTVGGMLIKNQIETFAVNSVNNDSENFTVNTVENDSQTYATYDNLLKAADSLNSHNMLLVDLEDNHIMGEKNSTESIYPASLTKIMTAIVALEELDNLSEAVPISQEIVDYTVINGASAAGFLSGEKVKAMDLLYAVMLPSGADACLGLAEHISGSEAGFVELMNRKAQMLGMENTNFVNCTGLHSDDHYTTLEDMAKLLNYALKNNIFKEIFTTSFYTTGETNFREEGVAFHSSVFEKMDSYNMSYGRIIGGKTGYTSNAGLCLASLAKVNGKEYLLITAGAPGGPNSEPYHLIDAVNVFNTID